MTDVSEIMARTISDAWAGLAADYLLVDSVFLELILEEQGRAVGFPQPEILEPWIHRTFGSSATPRACP